MATPVVTKKTTKATRKGKATTPKTETPMKAKAANDKRVKEQIRWSMKTWQDVVAALDARDEQRRKDHDAKLKSRRDEVAEMDKFIRSVLERPEVKVMARPRQAVIDALLKEKKQTAGQAKGTWNEFRLVCLVGMYDE
jgi:hypothetical protein